MRRWNVCLALILALLPIHWGQAQPPARNVVVMTMDGFRWQEMFTGADRAYFKQEKNGEPGASRKAVLAAWPRGTTLGTAAVHVGHDRRKGADFWRSFEGEPRPCDQRAVVFVSGLQRDVLRRR